MTDDLEIVGDKRVPTGGVIPLSSHHAEHNEYGGGDDGQDQNNNSGNQPWVCGV